MHIQFSIPFAASFNPGEGECDGQSFSSVHRPSDWGLKGVRGHAHHVIEAFGAIRAAKSADVLILCTVGIEAFVAARLRRWAARRGLTLIIFDPLIPRDSRVARIVGPWLARADAIAVIRRGDVETLVRRFGVPKQRCGFVAFPSAADLTETSVPSRSSDEGYIYSAGWAHRDWATLVKALLPLPYRAILAPGHPISIPESASDRITVIPMPSPAQGRQLMARARAVVLAMTETELPSGPLVLLDALAYGKPTIATAVNGTRDYIVDGYDGVLVEPGNSSALSNRIRQVMEDEFLRSTLQGNAIKSTVTFSNQATIQTLVRLAVTVHSDSTRPRA